MTGKTLRTPSTNSKILFNKHNPSPLLRVQSIWSRAIFTIVNRRPQLISVVSAWVRPAWKLWWRGILTRGSKRSFPRGGKFQLLFLQVPHFTLPWPKFTICITKLFHQPWLLLALFSTDASTFSARQQSRWMYAYIRRYRCTYVRPRKVSAV